MTQAKYTGDGTEQEAYELANEFGDSFEFSGRIGDRMKHMVELVNHNGPYPSMHQLAVQGGPHGSADYGYRSIHRCRQRDLIKIEENHDDATYNSRGAVVLTAKGRNLAQQI